ncbi:hypothetical protein NE857_30920 [Nocardiopsis exhalans]|uniref:Uncharacterized protein n=1 Tax=Nocardiopsis exhalans TaxID=163604 RepID=A0ABY5D917_9ACTN|nr:hypothetical protein [Nocardiopsis exhalans]USY19601.1 hypothetical protein NE857_30920 [Nocardiopsis exhalans]
MHQPSGRHRRPRRTLAGQAWAIAAALLAAALTFVFVPHTPRREGATLPPAPDRPRLSAAPAPPAPPTEPEAEPTRIAPEPGYFPDRRAWATSARDTSTRWANGYREAVPDEDEDAGPLARPYMPPPPEPRPLVPRPRMPEGDLLAAPPRTPHRTAPGTPGRAGGASARKAPNAPDDMDDLAAVIRTYLAVVG